MSERITSSSTILSATTCSAMKSPDDLISIERTTQGLSKSYFGIFLSPSTLPVPAPPACETDDPAVGVRLKSGGGGNGAACCSSSGSKGALASEPTKRFRRRLASVSCVCDVSGRIQLTVHLILLEPDQQDALGHQLKLHQTLFARIRRRRFTKVGWRLALLGNVCCRERRSRFWILFGRRFIYIDPSQKTVHRW